ncbi:4Fe-4S dicluster domain-containing protein [Candidatus Bathyarchaeota archaeon]|nr:4Fe-4S dicluster domain-containing protein [Candidatus Bathyarchaeota archaeon]
MDVKGQIWIARDFPRCSGCRMCEIACSLHHENKIWPEASRVRIFMKVPGAEFPHLCTQCHDYPCVSSCPVDALTVDKRTAAVLVDRDKCTGCGLCIKACPGSIPFLHPKDGKATICDLCNGDPQCTKVCTKGGWNTLRRVSRDSDYSYKLYARKPEEITKSLLTIIYGEKGEELI